MPVRSRARATSTHANSEDTMKSPLLLRSCSTSRTCADWASTNTLLIRALVSTYKSVNFDLHDPADRVRKRRAAMCSSAARHETTGEPRRGVSLRLAALRSDPSLVQVASLSLRERCPGYHYSEDLVPSGCRCRLGAWLVCLRLIGLDLNIVRRRRRAQSCAQCRLHLQNGLGDRRFGCGGKCVRFLTRGGIGRSEAGRCRW